MSKFLLIDNLPSGTTAQDLAKYLQKELETKHVEKIWLDPFLEPRAVAMFKKDVDQMETKQLQEKDTIFGDIHLKFITSTQSIFVRTYGSLSKSPEMMLRKMFSSGENGGSVIRSVNNIDDDCYEILFENGWYAVNSVCDREWKVKNCKLSVCPYFDCFKEPVTEHCPLTYLAQGINKMELAAEKNLDPKIKSAAFEESSIVFTHPIIPILLDLFHFDKAVKVTHNDLHIVIDKKKYEVYISGPKEYVDKIHHILTAEDEKITSSDEYLEFFRDENVEILKQVRAKNTEIDLSLRKMPAISIKDDVNKRMISIDDYLSTTIVRKVCGKFIQESYERNIEWRNFVQSFHSQYPTFKIVVKDRFVILCGLAENEHAHDLLVSDIRKFLNHQAMWSQEMQVAYSFNDGSSLESLSKRSRTPSDTKKTLIPSATEKTFGKESGSLKDVPQANGVEKTTVLPLTALKREFCIRFLKDKLMALEKNESTKIIIGKCSLEFKCASPERLQHTRKKVELLLKEFYCLEDHLQYPGLRAYVRSKEGRQFIDHLSNINQCVIEFPNIKSQGKRFDYKSIIIGTAQTDHLKIHLVQGDYTDFNVRMKVEFCPIKGGAEKMCSVTAETSSHKIIALPPWKQCPSAKKYYLASMRKSLQESLCLVLKQASQSNCTQLLFSTSKMYKTEFPFPVDCLAKSLINELISTFQPSIAQIGLRADVFICEIKSEAVFKAFTFYLEQSNIPLKYPDQDTWDGISLPKPMSNRNKSFVAIIELMANNPDIWEDGILFCYPIQPELKSITCPAICEYSCSKQLLQDDLRKLLFKKPDGLAIGEPCRVNCFTNGKEALVYCFPKWGPGCDEAIHVALKSCLLGSAEYRAVHIIPPGFHVFPNYPLKYLVTTICQVLDQLLSEGILNKQRKIVLIVDNKEYRKEFRKELEHYFPESFENQWENRIRNKIWAPENKDFTEISNANWDILVSETSCKGVPIVICGHSKINTENTLAALNGKMHSFMRENSSKQELYKNETLLFQKIIQNVKDLPVSFVLEKHYSNRETLPSKYLHVRGKESSERGRLEMRKSVHTCHTPGKSSVMESGASSFNTRRWGKSPSIMERRSSSFNTREGGKYPFSSSERGASPISYRDRGTSPSGARERVKSPCLKDGERPPRDGVKSPTCARERGTSLHVPREGVKSPTDVRERGKSFHIPLERGTSPHIPRERGTSLHIPRGEVNSPTGVRERGKSHIPRERGTSPHIPREKGTSHIPRERRTSHSFREKGTFCSDSTERDKSLHYSQDKGNPTYSTYSGMEMNSSISEGPVLTHRPTARGKLGPASFEIRKMLSGSTLTVHGLSDQLIKMFMTAISDACKANPHNLSKESNGFPPKVVDFEQSDEDSAESLISEDN